MHALRLLLVSSLVVIATGCADDPVPQRYVPSVSAPPVLYTDADEAVTFTVTGSDAEDAEDALSVNLATEPAHGLVLPSGERAPSEMSYTPDAGFSGVDVFAVTVTDSSGLTSPPATVVVVVAEPVVVPVDTAAPDAIGPSFLIVSEDQSTDFALTGSDDVDAETELSITVIVPPSLGTLNMDTGAAPLLLTYTPSPGVHGVDTMAFQVSDSAGNTSPPELVAVVIESVNDAPTATHDDGTTDSVTPITVDVVANDSDPDGEALVIVAVTQPSQGIVTFDGVGGTVTFTPEHPSSGDFAFEYTIRDAAGETSTATVTVTVNEAAAVAVTSFQAVPPYPLVGETVTLSWSSTNATVCTLSPGLDTGGATDGSVEWTASVPMTFVISCDGPAGPATAEAMVSPWPYDADGDGLHDMLETLTGTDPLRADTDGDLIPDGVEDSNANGQVDQGETDPRAVDSDADGLGDGVEDANRNGTVDSGETDPTDRDSDDDGWRDGDEDLDRDGKHDSGELDPLDPDTDDDGVCDGPRVDGESDGILPDDACADPAVYFVDASIAVASPDGLTWDTAFASIQDAVDAAGSGDHVWVASGTYVADVATNPVVTLKSGVQLLGGFLGNENTLADRSWLPEDSVLSGDFAGDDAASATNTSDNSTNVVVIPAGATNVTVDGFTLQGGFGGLQPGAGLNAESGAQSRLLRLRLTGNSALAGGGMHVLGGEHQIHRCTFDLNTATFGAALYSEGATLAISDIIVAGNEVLQFGYGGVVIQDGYAKGSRVRFRSNLGENATALYIQSSQTILTDVSLINNSALDHIVELSGVGAYFQGVDVTVAHNASLNGAMFEAPAEADGLLFTNASFLDNITSAGSAFVNGEDVFMTFRNTGFWGNSPNVISCTSCNFQRVGTCGDTGLNLAGEVLERVTFKPIFTEAASGEVFLSDDSICIDGGDLGAAEGPGGYGDTAGLDWRDRTTRIDRITDTGLVDAGRHHAASAAFIQSWELDATDVAWEVVGAFLCRLDVAGQVTSLTGEQVSSGSMPHGGVAGDPVTLTCWGDGPTPYVSALVP